MYSCRLHTSTSLYKEVHSLQVNPFMFCSTERQNNLNTKLFNFPVSEQEITGQSFTRNLVNTGSQSGWCCTAFSAPTYKVIKDFWAPGKQTEEAATLLHHMHNLHEE